MLPAGHHFPVLPFAVPTVVGSADRWTVADIEKPDAGRLFALRARAARESFAEVMANAPVIAELCHHLDGLPLAIEVLRLIARDQTDREIAATLDLDVRTVNTYVANARRELGAPSRTAAVAAMLAHGLA